MVYEYLSRLHIAKTETMIHIMIIWEIGDDASGSLRQPIRMFGHGISCSTSDCNVIGSFIERTVLNALANPHLHQYRYTK
jgi:hypothetical protein